MTSRKANVPPSALRPVRTQPPMRSVVPTCEAQQWGGGRRTGGGAPSCPQAEPGRRTQPAKEVCTRCSRNPKSESESDLQAPHQQGRTGGASCRLQHRRNGGPAVGRRVRCHRHHRLAFLPVWGTRLGGLLQGWGGASLGVQAALSPAAAVTRPPWPRLPDLQHLQLLAQLRHFFFQLPQVSGMTAWVRRGAAAARGLRHGAARGRPGRRRSGGTSWSSRAAFVIGCELCERSRVGLEERAGPE